MTAFIAHLYLIARRRRPGFVGRYWWAYCCHRSHRWRLRCWRWSYYDGYCLRHNNTCYTDCVS